MNSYPEGPSLAERSGCHQRGIIFERATPRVRRANMTDELSRYALAKFHGEQSWQFEREADLAEMHSNEAEDKNVVP